MCGITGYYGIEDRELLRNMCASLIHRGPDEDGFYMGENIGLAMRRLSIIDLKTGRQPITNESRDVWVVFNGEIYNYEDLREKLKAKGHFLSTSSDTETLAHLYEDYGLEFVDHIRGMFGIALWDARMRRLVLVRDRIGEKPLYYSWDGKKLLFGSEIKAILQSGIRREVNPQAVCDFLATGYVQGEHTFFKGIRKLLPGHLLVLESGKIHVKQYWLLDRKQAIIPASYEQSIDELESRLVETVRSCLKSDVEVGAFLSGGVDSSLIVALMRKQAAHVKTFTVGYDGMAKGFNELKYAKRVATLLGTEHHELILGAHSSMELFPRILWHYDEPHGEPTSVLVFHLCEFTRRTLKVALGGTGGDEIFFGYPRHKALRFLEYYLRIPRRVRKSVLERIVSKWPESTRGSRFAKRAKRFVLGTDNNPEKAYLSWLSLLGEDLRQDLFSSSVREAAEDPTGDRFLRECLEAGGGSLLDRAATIDVRGYLPEYQLSYMDRMSMAHGLEVRSPLCDYDLVQYAVSLPDTYRLKGIRSKSLLKDVAVRWLPRDIVDRRKVGFDSPIGQWYKGKLRGYLKEFLSPEQVAKTGLLDPTKVQMLIADHLSGRKDYSLQLWSIMALEGWHRMYIEDAVRDGTQYKLHDMRGAADPIGLAP